MLNKNKLFLPFILLISGISFAFINQYRKSMKKTNLSEDIKIIGLKTKTTNQDIKKITDLWAKFFSQIHQIPNVKNPNKIYSIYTEYESDFNGAYSCIIGLEVNDFSNLPEGFTKITIPQGSYIIFSGQGNPSETAPKLWNQIWNSKLDRTYSIDFEEYDSSESKENPKVNIYINVK